MWWQVNLFAWLLCGTVFAWLPCLAPIAMLLTDVERHVHHTRAFEGLLKRRAGAVILRALPHDSELRRRAALGGARASRRSSWLTARAAPRSESTRGSSCSLSDMTCIEANELYMALYARARHVNETFHIVMAPQARDAAAAASRAHHARARVC